LVTSSPTTSRASPFAVNAASASLATRAADRSCGKSTCTCFEELITDPRHRQRTSPYPFARSASRPPRLHRRSVQFLGGRWLHSPRLRLDVGASDHGINDAPRRTPSSRRSISSVWATPRATAGRRRRGSAALGYLVPMLSSVSTQPRRDNEAGASRRGGHYERRGVITIFFPSRC
jgi:hypothetical protein